MPLSAAARTGLRAAHTGLWAHHGSGLWLFRLTDETTCRATAQRGLHPLWGGHRQWRETKQSQGREWGEEEGR